MISYSMCLNGARICETQQIIWKMTKDKRKIGIIIYPKKYYYQYHYEFDNHCYEFLYHTTPILFEMKKEFEKLFSQEE